MLFQLWVGLTEKSQNGNEISRINLSVTGCLLYDPSKDYIVCHIKLLL